MIPQSLKNGISYRLLGLLAKPKKPQAASLEITHHQLL